MKMTRSLPAKAIASAKVPSRTTIRKTLTCSQWSTCITTVKPARQARSSVPLLAAIHSFASEVMKAVCLTPLMSMK